MLVFDKVFDKIPRRLCVCYCIFVINSLRKTLHAFHMCMWTCMHRYICNLNNTDSYKALSISLLKNNYVFLRAGMEKIARVRAGTEMNSAGPGGYWNQHCGYGRAWNEIWYPCRPLLNSQLYDDDSYIYSTYTVSSLDYILFLIILNPV